MTGLPTFPRRRESLAGKLAGLLCAAGLFAATLSYLLLNQTLEPVFGNIEQRVVNDQVARAEFALNNYMSVIGEKNLDYAFWDETFDYVTTGDPTYESQVKTASTLINLDIDVMAVRRFDGTKFYTSALGRSQQKLDAGVEALADEALLDPRVLERIESERSSGFYVPMDGAVYAIHAAYVLRSDETGDPVGFHVMGSRLREDEISSALQVDAELDFTPDQAMREAFADPASDSTSTVGDSEIVTILPLRGNAGELLGTISFATPRSITFAGARAILLATLVMAASLLLLAVLIWTGIQRIVVRRLEALGNHVAAFNQHRQPVSETLLAASDEVGALARQFETLGTELEEAEEELRQQSYVQGKADSAVGLLHNIRNALGPLQVKHEKWLAEDTKPYRGQLRQALDELSDAPAGERRQKLEQFAAQATGRLIASGEERACELAEIKDSIDQIVGILAGYDFDSSREVSVESLSIVSLIRREITNQNERLPAPIQLEVDGDIPQVLANRIVCAQIIGNLVTNAIEAMQDADVHPMCLAVKATSDDGERLEVAISDNGSGADAETLARVFERGFSTRGNKSGGAGLHWSANAANALGGKLALVSDGPGLGATALLTLPLAEAADLRAAA